MRRRVARTATLLALCLLLGPATTMVTAWALKAWYQKYPTPVPRQTYMGTEGDTTFQVTFTKAMGRMSVVYNALPPPGSGWVMFRTEGDPDPLPLRNEPTWAALARRTVPHLIGVGAYGWPVPALKSITASSASSTLYSGVWETPLTVGVSGQLRLPVSPHWPGMLIDSALFSAAWLSLLAGLPALRRALRRRQNRCPSCGYSLAGVKSPACPECGEPTSRSLARA